MEKYTLLVYWLALGCSVHTSLAQDQVVGRNKPPLFSSLNVLHFPPLSISNVGNTSEIPHEVFELVAQELPKSELYNWGNENQVKKIMEVYNRRGLELIGEDITRISFLENGEDGRNHAEMNNVLSYLNNDSYTELFTVYTNTQKAVDMGDVNKWLKPGDSSLDAFIQKFEELEKVDEELVKVDNKIAELKSMKPSDEQAPGQVNQTAELDEAVEKQTKIQREYSKQREYISSMLSSKGLTTGNIVIIHRSIFWDSKADRILSLKYDTKELRTMRDLLKGLDASHTADQITWVPFSELEDPVRRFLFFPLFSIRRAVTEVDFHQIIFKAQFLAHERWLSSEGWKDVAWHAGHAMLKALVLDFILHDAVDEALSFAERVCNETSTQWSFHWGETERDCVDSYKKFMDSVAEQDWDKRKEKAYPDSLFRYGLEYAKFQVNDRTNKAEWHLAISMRDYEIGNAWANLYKESLNPNSEQDQPIAG